MDLVIVESPTKSKTISKFLGKEYRVMPSFGHVRDLPKGDLGVDVENNFEPRYVIPVKSRKIVKALKEVAKKSETVILATDADREGEAIAWHLTEALEQTAKNKNARKKPFADKKEPNSQTLNYKRIVFHEITSKAIEKALENPRNIDMNLVNAQQARRILDRLVGYKLSPFLWKKVARGLSAGRVQSVAVRLIVEREKEIQNFKSDEYWTIVASLIKITGRGTENKKEFEATLIKKDGETILKLGIKSEKEAENILKNLEGAEYKVNNIEKKESRRNPLPPFTTSTLQQTAWQRFHFPAKFTMSLAQHLYESGHITYHRTDSLNLSEQSIFAAKKFISDNLGENYWAGFPRQYKTKSKGAQEAHEAIRPTIPENDPQNLKDKLESAQLKLYDLIWKRFIACQMAQAILDSTSIDIQAKNYGFRATGSVMKFDGFLKIYPMKFEENELPLLEREEILKLAKLMPSQHFTEPPPRYNDATLIKALEGFGIGRPSTYAPIISTIQERNYVIRNEKKYFTPSEIGIMVNDLLVKHFPEIVDTAFTATMEKNLDEIAEGLKQWAPTIKEFYEPFEKNLLEKYEEISDKESIVEKTGKKCPECGGDIIIRFGRFGKFYACSNFPKCKYTEPMPKETLDIKCPRCKEGEIEEKRTKRGKIFYGCSNWPKCDFALWDKPINKTCPKCGSLLVETKRGVKCSNKECDFLETNNMAS